MNTISSAQTFSEDTIIRIVQSYYDSVDSRDAEQLANMYLRSPSTTLAFNADAPIIGVDAIRAFTAQFFQAVSVRHTMVDIWTTALMGEVLPIEMPPGRSAATVTVVSTALPTFTIGSGADARTVAVPATSIFTIDKQSEKFVSVHNMFDIGKVYAAVQAAAGSL
jgi:hypothetical protein